MVVGFFRAFFFIKYNLAQQMEIDEGLFSVWRFDFAVVAVRTLCRFTQRRYAPVGCVV